MPSQDRYVETWKAFVDAPEGGLVRSIGVSNFQPDHLRRIIDETGVTPSVNQIELHPYLQQAPLRREHDELGIVTEAWSPLAQGEVLDDPAITAIAEAHGKTAGPGRASAGTSSSATSCSRSRSRRSASSENFDVFDFELTDDQMEAIDALDTGERIGPDPDTFTGG